MKLELVPDRCQGHSRCHALAPALVGVDAMGRAVLLNDGEVPTALLNDARLIVANCPEGALRLVDDIMALDRHDR